MIDKTPYNSDEILYLMARMDQLLKDGKVSYKFRGSIYYLKVTDFKHNAYPYD